MTNDNFFHVNTWVFDLDNTLYPPEAALFDQIEVKMTNWVMSALGVSKILADDIRRKYWEEYGTTLAGLMKEHNVDPAPYLHEVHDIDLSHLEIDQQLSDNIASLPGRKFVYTNGSAEYAGKVLEARGMQNVFDAVYGVEQAGFKPKPERAAFEKIFAIDGIQPAFAAMFEDDIRNLTAPHDMGMRTVHVAPKAIKRDHIHYHTDNLTEFLKQLV